MIKIKDLLKKLNPIKVKKDYSSLTDDQLKHGYKHSREYCEAFKGGKTQENIRPELTKVEALNDHEKSLLIMETEMRRRGIDPNKFTVSYSSKSKSNDA